MKYVWYFDIAAHINTICFFFCFFFLFVLFLVFFFFFFFFCCCFSTHILQDVEFFLKHNGLNLCEFIQQITGLTGLRLVIGYVAVKTQVSLSTTKHAKWPVRPAKTQISVHPPGLISRRCTLSGAEEPTPVQTDWEDAPSGRKPMLILAFARSFTVFHYWKFEPQHNKTNKMSVRPAKTKISLGIRPVWSVFAVCSVGS